MTKGPKKWFLPQHRVFPGTRLAYFVGLKIVAAVQRRLMTIALKYAERPE